MQNLKVLAAAVIGTLVLIVGAGFLLSGDESKANKPVDQVRLLGDQRHVEATSSGVLAVGSEASTSSNEANIKATIVEFSDFQCPACKASQPLVDQVMSKYAGKVRLVYRNFPLEQLHKNALAAARVAEAVAETGKYWPFHDVLFEKQEEWAESGNVEEFFNTYAKDLGIDTEVVKKGLTDNKYLDLVRKDQSDGTALGINATPTFFVNGVKVDTVSLSGAVENALK
jgi:protein-disulfide isomerase